MATQVSKLGKKAVLEQLFEKSGFINTTSLVLSEKGECCTTTKMLLEGVDFDLTYNPLKHLGYKAVLSVIGEIYAKFFTPISLSLVLGLSNRFSYEDIKEFWEGVMAAVKEHSIKHLSLDLNPSKSGLAISVSACGVQKRSVLDKLPSSKKFDLICLSGNLGAAYMGLHVLEREKVAFHAENKQPDLSSYKYILESYLSPQIDSKMLNKLIEFDIYPSKGYFLTRGLAPAIEQLAKDSASGAKIYMDKIPIASQTFAMADELNMDAMTAALNGGEDYKFIFTIPIEKNESFKKEFPEYDIIGHLARPEVGAVLVTPDGAEINLIRD